MADSIQRFRHVAYRLKNRLLHESLPARRLRGWIWKKPQPGVVQTVFREEQDISHYFDWKDIDGLAATRLRGFTEKYAREPNIVYEFRGDLVIEPMYGLTINKGRQYIRESGTLSHLFLTPSLVKHLVHRLLGRPYTQYDKLIHIDCFAGTNLCHFIYDVVNPALFLYERGMITITDRLLIGEKVYRKPFFQYFLAHTILGKFNWVVQKDNEWIKAKEIRRPFVSMEIFKSTYAMLRHDVKPHRKIFLDRRGQHQRNIRNILGIKAVLDSHGFETVYAEDLSYEDQVSLFRTVKYFVGIHGAGLTNLLHARIPELRVLEVFPANVVHASFYRFLRILDVGYYDALAGSEADIHWSFTVNEDEFKEKVDRMMLQP
jgi:hypothetical protein